MDDNEIVDLFYKRESRSISECERKYSKYCLLIANNILHCYEDSEECVNDTMLRAWNSIPPAKPVSLKFYLGKIARNLAIDRYRSRATTKRGNCTVEEALEELSECIPTECVDLTDRLALSEVVNGFLAKLSSPERVVFIKKYWYLYSVGEIAKTEHMKEGTVLSMLFRTRKKFRSYLEKEEIDV